MSLGLPQPDFLDPSELILSIDEEDVVFRQGADGNVLVVEVDAGKFLASASHERGELEKVLKTNLALCTVRNTIAVLDNREAEENRVSVRGFYRYRNNDLAQLSDLVSDVLSSGETLRAVLAGSAVANRRPGSLNNLSEAPDSGLLILNL